MDGPSDDFRADVVLQVEDIGSEDQLADFLDWIEGHVREDVASREDGGQDPEAELGAVMSWATVVSDAMARFSAPNSPWPRRLAGWGKKLLAHIQRIANILLSHLQSAAKALGASSWSISVGFPWGISVSLTWP